MSVEHPIHWLPKPAPESELEARWATVDSYVHDRVARINARCGDTYRARLDATLARLRRDNRSTRAKIKELWRLADDFGSYTGDEVACKRGCSHCCHIAVSVPRQEAELIGDLIGRKPAVAAPRISFEDVPWGYDSPCTFLRDGECSIYEHRPMACRVHYSVDVDDLLCRLDPPRSNRVPFLNTTALTFTMVDICAAGSWPHYADVREWFPR